MENKPKRGRPAKAKAEVIDVEVAKDGKQETGIEIARQPTAITQFQESSERLISMAIDKNVPVETMEKLLAMRRELRAEAAKEEYNRAMAAFQAECPIIEKTTDGGKTKEGSEAAYKYATLDHIIKQTRDIIAKHGFSYTFRQENDGNKVKVACIVSHIAGHSEESVMETGLSTKTGIMSGPQQIAATVSFNKRYSFCNAFGIATGDADVDAAKSIVEPPQPPPATPPKPPVTPPKAPEQPKTPQFINQAQADELNGLIRTLRIKKEDVKREMENVIEGDIKEFKMLTAKEADLIIADFKARLAKVQAAPDANVVDPSINPPAPAPKQDATLATRAMNCKTQEEARDIMGEAALTKDITETKTLALKNILTSKGFTV